MLQLDREYSDLLDREWNRLAEPGTWLDAQRRIDIARATRAARRGETARVALQPAVAEAARRLSAEPATVNAEWVDAMEAEGLDRVTYVEVLGVVARMAAIDTFLFGAGHPERMLPEPIAGEPSRRPVADAEMNGGFAPTVGPVWPPNTLSAVAAEDEALHDLHGTLYLSIAQMGDLGIERSLTRPQMELVASRTSLLNECFF